MLLLAFGPFDQLFLLSLGPMSVTLLDVYAIAAFPLIGTHIEDMASLSVPSIPKDVLSYGKFLETYSRSPNSVDLDEQVLFLLFWLSKYISSILQLKFPEIFYPLLPILPRVNHLLWAH